MNCKVTFTVNARHAGLMWWWDGWMAAARMTSETDIYSQSGVFL